MKKTIAPKPKLLAALLTLTLVACAPESSEFYPVGVGGGAITGGATSGSAPARPIPAKTPLTPTKPLPMLQDPEGNLEDQSITIYAVSHDEALGKCQQEAKSRSDQNTIVTCLGCKLMTSPKTGRYACTLRIETRQP
jgi:hypothetical protein